MSRTGASSDMDAYIAEAAPKARPILREIRRVVQAAVPDAQESFGYRMPAFRTQRNFIYFAAWLVRRAHGFANAGSAPIHSGEGIRR